MYIYIYTAATCGPCPPQAPHLGELQWAPLACNTPSGTWPSCCTAVGVARPRWVGGWPLCLGGHPPVERNAMHHVLDARSPGRPCRPILHGSLPTVSPSVPMDWYCWGWDRNLFGPKTRERSCCQSGPSCTWGCIWNGRRPWRAPGTCRRQRLPQQPVEHPPPMRPAGCLFF